MTKTINTTTVATSNAKKEFNSFNWIKFNALKGYFANGEKPTFEFRYNGIYDNKVFYYLEKSGALVVDEYTTGNYYTGEVDDNGNKVYKRMTVVKVREINLNARATSKAGKEYDVFFTQEIGGAKKSAEREKCIA